MAKKRRKWPPPPSPRLMLDRAYRLKSWGWHTQAQNLLETVIDMTCGEENG